MLMMSRHKLNHKLNHKFSHKLSERNLFCSQTPLDILSTSLQSGFLQKKNHLQIRYFFSQTPLQSQFHQRQYYERNQQSNRDNFTSPSSLYTIALVGSSIYVLNELLPIFDYTSYYTDKYVIVTTFFVSSILWPLGVPLLYFEYTQEALKDYITKDVIKD